jgi:hypothetical protein
MTLIKLLRALRPVLLLAAVAPALSACMALAVTTTVVGAGVSVASTAVGAAVTVGKGAVNVGSAVIGGGDD